MMSLTYIVVTVFRQLRTSLHVTTGVYSRQFASITSDVIRASFERTVSFAIHGATVASDINLRVLFQVRQLITSRGVLSLIR